VSRALNLALALLLVGLAGLLAAPRLRARAPEPPSFEELHGAALARFEAGAPDALPALERARGAIEDPLARELYGRGIDHARAGARDLAEAELAEAARGERARWLER
jgi:hypothetical protein